MRPFAGTGAVEGDVEAEVVAETEPSKHDDNVAIEEGEMAVADAENAMQEFVAGLQAEAEKAQRELPHPRGAMVSAFGDVGFALAVGEVGLATFDAESSPFGWHVIKRLA